MSRKLNDKQVEEIEQAKNFAQFILQHLSKLMPPNAPSYLEQFDQIVKETFEKQDLRGMRYLLKDISEIARDLNKQQVEQLNQLLREKFNKDLNNELNLKKIKSIISNGKIKNLAEYELLSSYLEIKSLDQPNELVRSIDQLLFDFQSKAGKG